MKKTIFSLALAGSSFAGTSVMASDATINFSGRIEASTCSIAPGAGATGSAGTLAVTLDTYSKGVFTAANQSLGRKKFAIALSGAGCVASKTYTMEFSGANIDAATGNLKIGTTASDAKGISLRMLNNADAVINLKTQENAPQVVTSATGTGTLDMSVEYYSTLAAVVEGDVKSSVEFVLKHN